MFKIFGSKCPLCEDEPPLKAFFAGFAFKMCDKCDCAYGCGALILDVLPFIGPIVIYEGSYWATLWAYLNGSLFKAPDS